MDLQERELIEKTLHLAEENNKMLHQMRRSMKWANAWRIFYWVIIIGLSIGAFYYVQPYINQLLEVYGGFKGDVSNVQNILGAFKGN